MRIFPVLSFTESPISMFAVEKRECTVYYPSEEIYPNPILCILQSAMPRLLWSRRFSILGFKKHTRNSIDFNSAEKIFQKPFSPRLLSPTFGFWVILSGATTRITEGLHCDFYNIEARYNAGIGTIKDVLAFSSVSIRIII